MRILFVHDVGAMIGGAEYSLLNLRNELVMRGHEVEVITSDSPEPDPGFSDYTFQSRDGSRAGKFFHYLYNRSAKETVRMVIRRFDPDLIHVCTITKLSPAGVKAMRGIPTVLDIRDYGLLYPVLHKVLPKADYCGFGDDACCPRHAGVLRYYFERMRVFLHKKNFPYFSAFIVNSDYVLQITERLGMRPSFNMNGPIEMKACDESKKLKLPNSILYAGRLEPEKGLTQLLDSFELVLKKIPDARLFIAGDGSMRTWISSRIQERALSGSVEILGMIDVKMLAEWYCKIRLVVVPSLWPEPFGRVGPEAMTFGVPVVASGKGGITDWLDHGQNGLIADPMNQEAFANAMIELLEDESYYQVLSRNALESSKKFHLDIYADKLERLYLDTIAESQPAAGAN